MAWPTSAFPTGLDAPIDKVDNVDAAMAADINGCYSALKAIEAKVGINSSAVATSLDYLLKNAASANPGHKHTVFPDNVNGSDKTLYTITLKDWGQTLNALGTLTGGTVTINLTLGNVVTATISTGATTFAFSNPSPSGVACSFTLILFNGGSQTITWPASVTWLDGTPLLLASGRNRLEFVTFDGGTNWYGRCHQDQSLAIASGPTFNHLHLTTNLQVDQIIELTAGHGIDIDGWHIKDGGAGVMTGGTNTFDIANGTAHLNIAAGSYLDVNANLTVTAATTLAGAASLTVAGPVELATDVETTAGNDATRAVTPDGLAGSTFGKRLVQVKIIDDGIDLTTFDTLVFVVPPEFNGYKLIDADAYVKTASTSGALVFYIYKNGSNMLSTDITIDINELTSYTAATQPVINATYATVATGDLIIAKCAAVGTGTKGAGVMLTFQLP